MIVLCTHHKGGAGKTTLAVHIAGVLAEAPGRHLLIDCDSQADAFEFLTRREPTADLDLQHMGDHLSILWNPKRQSIETITDVAEYDDVILDIDTALANTVQTIVQDHPDLVVVPISRPHEALALRHLPDVLQVVSTLATQTGIAPHVKVVPLGVSRQVVVAAVGQGSVVPSHCEVTTKAPDLTRQMKQAFADRKFIWSYPDERCQRQKEFFQKLIED